MRARPARDRAGLRGRRGYPAWRRHVRVNSAPLCARPCAGHMRYADSNHLRNSPRRQEVSPLFLCEDSVAGRGRWLPCVTDPPHDTARVRAQSRADFNLHSQLAGCSISQPHTGFQVVREKSSQGIKGWPIAVLCRAERNRSPANSKSL